MGKNYILINKHIQILGFEKYLDFLKISEKEEKKICEYYTSIVKNNEVVSIMEGSQREYLYLLVGLLGGDVYTKNKDVKNPLIEKSNKYTFSVVNDKIQYQKQENCLPPLCDTEVKTKDDFKITNNNESFVFMSEYKTITGYNKYHISKEKIKNDNEYIKQDEGK